MLMEWRWRRAISLIPKEVMVSEEKVAFSMELLVRNALPQEVKTPKEPSGLSKIGRSREEWSAWRNNRLGALKTNVLSPGRRKKVPSEIMQRHTSHDSITPPSYNC
jgi:hypothetical protein